MLDELAAHPAPSKKRPAAKAARKRRVASPAELAKSPRPRHALCQSPNLLKNVQRNYDGFIHNEVPLISKNYCYDQSRYMQREKAFL